MPVTAALLLLQGVAELVKGLRIALSAPTDTP